MHSFHFRVLRLNHPCVPPASLSSLETQRRYPSYRNNVSRCHQIVRIVRTLKTRTTKLATTTKQTPRWRGQARSQPAQVLVNDIRLERWRRDAGPLLEIKERLSSSLVPDTASITPSASYVRAAEAATNPIEQQRFARLEEEYGWMRYLRLQQYQQYPSDTEDSAKCRWIHCSSKFPEYLRGFLWALTDDYTAISKSVQALDDAVQQHARFSKHGKYFAPFAQTLRHAKRDDSSTYPMLISLPFSGLVYPRTETTAKIPSRPARRLQQRPLSIASSANGPAALLPPRGHRRPGGKPGLLPGTNRGVPIVSWT